MNYRRRCRTCRPVLAKGRTSNGAWQVFRYCFECERRAEVAGEKPNIPHVDVPDLDALPVAWDRLGENWQACERCGQVTDTECHHWAPKHKFIDADDWPTSQLCRQCHMEWHAKMTPDMSKQEGAFSRFLRSDPSAGMVRNELEDWERIESEGDT